MLKTHHIAASTTSPWASCTVCGNVTAWHSPCECHTVPDPTNLPGIALTLLCLLAGVGVVTLVGWAWRALALWGG